MPNFSLKAMLSSIRDSISQDGRAWRWGTKDNFPNIIIDSANDSGVARECIDKLETFIAGDGIKDQAFLDTLANPDQTWGELDRAINQTLAYIPGIALRVLYNAGGLPAEFHLLPIQNVRKRYDGQFIYSPDLGDPSGFQSFTGRHREIIPAFGTAKTPSEVRAMMAKQIAKHDRQLGELLYTFTPGVGLNYQHYPVPKWSSGLNDINADAALSLHEESQVSNSFKAGVIIQTRPLDKVLKDENGRTEYDYFQAESEKFCSPDGSPILHLETLNGESAASVTPLNIQHQMDATEKATDRIGRKVCRLFGVPPILCGFATAGTLGESQELVNHMKLFNLTLKKKWELKERMYKSLFPEVPKENFETVEIDMFSFLPDKVIESMTVEQVNEAFQLPAVKDKVDQEVSSRFAEFGVGGVQGILSIQTSVSEQIIGIDAGAKVLEVIYGFDAERAYQMLGGVATIDNEGQVKDAPKEEVREVNEHLKTLTGKQQQQIDRVVRKFNKGELTDSQAIMQLTSGFGFTDEEAKTYLAIEETTED